MKKILIVLFAVVLCACEPPVIPGPPTPTRAAAPRLSQTPGIYPDDLVVALSSPTPGSVIHFTLDGGEPDENSTVYEAPIAVAGDRADVTIKAFARADGYLDSETVTARFRIDYSMNYVSDPVFSPAPGTYDATQYVRLTCATAGTEIYFTTDGTDPTPSSPRYSATIRVAGDNTEMTIRARAFKSGLDPSAIAAGAYKIEFQTVADPVFSIDSGDFLRPFDDLVLSTATPSARITYTVTDRYGAFTDTSTAASVTVGYRSCDAAVSAFAHRTGMRDSATVTKTYNFKEWKPLGRPSFSAARVKHPDLAVAPDGTVYVSYVRLSFTSPMTSSLVVQKHTGAGATGWEDVGAIVLPPLEAQTLEYSSLEIDAAGTLSVAYNKGIFYYTAASGWQRLSLSRPWDATVNPVKLILHNGVPHVLAGNLVYRYTGTGATGWETVGPGFVEVNTQRYASIAVDDAGIVHVAVIRSAAPSRLSVKKCENGAWTAVGSEVILESKSGFSMDECDIVFHNGALYACGGPTALKHTGQGAIGWEPVGDDLISNSGVYNTRLGFDGQDNLYAAYAASSSNTGIGAQWFDPHTERWLGMNMNRNVDPSQMNNHFGLGRDASGRLFLACTDETDDMNGSITALYYDW